MHRYIYADKVGAGPENPNKQWGLFTKELTPDEAQARYELNARQDGEWFGIVRFDEELGRPTGLIQMCPQANGLKMQKLDAHGRVEASYIWGGYYEPHHKDPTPYNGNATQIMLAQITWYAYPEEERFLDLLDSIGRVTMQFEADGYVKESIVTSHGFGNPEDVETRESRGVDVSHNWFDIPKFGDWEPLFNPTPTTE